MSQGAYTLLPIFLTNLLVTHSSLFSNLSMCTELRARQAWHFKIQIQLFFDNNKSDSKYKVYVQIFYIYFHINSYNRLYFTILFLFIVFGK